LKYRDLVLDFERGLLAKALEDCAGNKKAAAASLEMPRSTFSHRVDLLQPRPADAARARTVEVDSATMAELRAFADAVGNLRYHMDVLQIKLGRLSPRHRPWPIKFEISRLRKHFETITKDAERLHGRFAATIGM
jgi:hypothetical protein